MLQRIATSLSLRSRPTAEKALPRFWCRVGVLLCSLWGACFDRDLVEGFCERDCAVLWTPACEERCGLSRPQDCSELDSRCPIRVEGEADEVLPVTGAGDGDDDPPLTDDGTSEEPGAGKGAPRPPSGGSEEGGSQAPAGDDIQGPPPVAEGPCGELCPEGRPICDPETQECIECETDEHCRKVSNGRYCVDRHCIGCATSADCSDPGASHCDETVGACVGCRTSKDCADVHEGSTATPICHVERRKCVQCSGTEYEACGRNAASSAALVCDSQAAVCTSLEEGSASLCDACLSDTHCAEGMKCVPEVFEGKTLDHICLWAFGDQGAPGDCMEARARPFSGERDGVVSIDGEQVDVCILATTTCEARSQAVVQPCAGPDADGSCGVPGLNDGLCRPRERDAEGPYACTVPCQSSRDCEPGYACSGGEGGSFCDLTRGSCDSAADCEDGQQCLERACDP